MFKNKLFLSLAFVLLSSVFYVNVTNAATHTVKTDEELDELERLRRENLRLKRQIEEKDMLVELLKKVKEFEGM